MNSYGYKVPGLQDRIARERRSASPLGVFLDASEEDLVPTAQASPEPGDVWVDESRSASTENVPSPDLERSISAREFFESQILPQVRASLGDSGVHDAWIRTQRQNFEARDQERIAEADRQALDRLRGTSVSVPVQLPQPISYKGLGSAGFQPGIPGLFGQVEDINDEIEQLRKQKAVEAFGDLLTKYPELNRVLYADPESQGKASRVRKAGFQPYLDYVDKEQVFSAPEDRAALYNQILSEVASLEDGDLSVSDVAETLREAEADYVSGDTGRQTASREFIRNILPDPTALDRIETQAFRENRPVIGGGSYVPVKGNPLVDKINRRAREFNSLVEQLYSDERTALAETFPGLRDAGSKSGRQEGFYLDPETREVSLADFDDPDAYGVDVGRYISGDVRLEELDKDLFTSDISENALRFLADYPITGETSVSFSTREPGDYRDPSYAAKLLPSELVNPITSFVADTAFSDLRPGTLVTNNPLSSGDLLDKRVEENKTKGESSTLRRLQPFIDANSELPNLRGLAYTSAGFGPVGKSNTQVAYVDDKGQAIPLQLERPEGPLRGTVAIRDSGQASVFRPSLPASATPRYYSLDPLSMAVSAVPEIAGNIRRVPASLLPGAADLIPSPEAIRTGYTQGPVEMGKQMAQEFAQSLPYAAGAATLLSMPAVAPLAPGIGAGMVGTAGARALNEVVRQETGEGVVPKVRQFLGTAPRTGVSSPQAQGDKPLTAQIRPLTQAQRAEMERLSNLNPVQRRLRLAGERFNPRKGEFGLSELLFGR